MSLDMATLVTVRETAQMTSDYTMHTSNDPMITTANKKDNHEHIRRPDA